MRDHLPDAGLVQDEAGTIYYFLSLLLQRDAIQIAVCVLPNVGVERWVHCRFHIPRDHRSGFHLCQLIQVRYSLGRKTREIHAVLQRDYVGAFPWRQRSVKVDISSTRIPIEKAVIDA